MTAVAMVRAGLFILPASARSACRAGAAIPAIDVQPLYAGAIVKKLPHAACASATFLAICKASAVMQSAAERRWAIAGLNAFAQSLRANCAGGRRARVLD
jgi:hypothetical protein